MATYATAMAMSRMRVPRLPPTSVPVRPGLPWASGIPVMPSIRPPAESVSMLTGRSFPC
jgi:hypothetical protein